jgi:hypothetical protein
MTTNSPNVIPSGRLPVSMELRFLDRQVSGGSGTPSPAWLAEVREMRARVWYGQGRRPSFQRADGSFDDSDAVDLRAFHLVARCGDQAVGCARVTPLVNIRSGVVSSLIGERRFETILRERGTDRERVCEASRWAVLPEFRGDLGPRLVAATWAVARWLSMDVAFVMAGTRQKQDLALIRMGARPVSDIPLVQSEVFDDELRLLCFNVRQPSQSMRQHIGEAAAALQLSAFNFGLTA